MSGDDDDPFAVFGDDDDESDDEAAVGETAAEAQQLMAKANQRLKQDDGVPLPSSRTRTEEEAADAIDVSKFDRVELDWDPPLYLGPVFCAALHEYGGGRAFVAERDLQPGTLIVVEKPSIEWPPDQVGKELGLVSVRHILNHTEAQKLVHNLEDFHPTKEGVDALKAEEDVQVREMIESFEQSLSDTLPATVELAKSKGFSNRDGTLLAARDIVRLLLALRYNGFESGVYLHLAMLNHDCYPNSVKFAPTDDFSEVRTTRFVKAGEALTISYLPRITSHASRRHHLWDQHRFDIGPRVSEEYGDMEKVGGLLPVSSRDERDESLATFRIEAVTIELEDHFQEATISAAQSPTVDNPVWEEVKALEVSSLELYREAKEQIGNEEHLLLIPCLRLHLDVCDLLQIGKSLTPNQHVLLLLRVVASATKFIALQTHLFGKDHFDLAKSYNELSQALAELLSRAPKKLVGLGLHGSVAACSAAEFRARKEFERIRDLYPRDVEEQVARGPLI